MTNKVIIYFFLNCNKDFHYEKIIFRKNLSPNVFEKNGPKRSYLSSYSDLKNKKKIFWGIGLLYFIDIKCQKKHAN